MTARRRVSQCGFVQAWHDGRCLKTSARDMAVLLRLFREDWPGEDLFWVWDRRSCGFLYVPSGPIHLVLQGPTQRFSISHPLVERPGSTSSFLALHHTGETRVVTAATLCDAFQLVRAKSKEPVGLLLNLTGIDHGPDTFAGAWRATVESWEADQ